MTSMEFIPDSGMTIKEDTRYVLADPLTIMENGKEFVEKYAEHVELNGDMKGANTFAIREDKKEILGMVLSAKDAEEHIIFIDGEKDSEIETSSGLYVVLEEEHAVNEDSDEVFSFMSPEPEAIYMNRDGVLQSVMFVLVTEEVYQMTDEDLETYEGFEDEVDPDDPFFQVNMDNWGDSSERTSISTKFKPAVNVDDPYEDMVDPFAKYADEDV